MAASETDSKECRVQAAESSPVEPTPEVGTVKPPRRHRVLYLTVAAAFVVAFVLAAAVSNQGSDEDKAITGSKTALTSSKTARVLKATNISMSGNPFAGKVFYKNPVNQASYDGSIATSTGAVKDNLIRMREVPSAYWIDVKSKIRSSDKMNRASSMGHATCSAEGENCETTKCCEDPSQLCYRKSPYWAGCTDTCTPGEPSPYDPPQYATPWSCELLSPSTPSPTPSPTVPPPAVSPPSRDPRHHPRPGKPPSGPITPPTPGTPPSRPITPPTPGTPPSASLRSLEGILADAAAKTTPEMVVFIWYDLPNRDCHAKASNGEICCKYLPDGRCDYTYQSDCDAGLQEYIDTYADPFVEVLEEYQDKVPIAIVVEPDSLPNLATNADDPRCGGKATNEAYKKGITYALTALSTKTPKVAVYLDAGHGGWLGWNDNLMDFMTMLKGMDLPFNKIRGFATNVANYQPLGTKCPYEPDSGTRNGYCLNRRHSDETCCEDPCGLAAEWSAGHNELNYAQELAQAARKVLGMQAHVIIDTGRNGQTTMRQKCKNWCNIRNAGAGVASTATTGYPEVVDAYFWLKTPGESDGCTETLPSGEACPRFDRDCASVDSLGSESSEPRAPEAGAWFDYQVKQLAEYAVLD